MVIQHKEPALITPTDIYHGKILIVDDKQGNILLLERILQRAGYTSITSTMEPGVVFKLHQEHSFDLILLDLQMPGMNGFEVMAKLKEIETESYLPVLVLTAQPEHKLHALKVGAKDFISKPFDSAEVLARVYNMLEVRLLHNELKALFERVAEDIKVTKRLLCNVLPECIADRLKGRRDVIAEGFTDVIADSFAEVTVLFADIVDFTRFSQSVSAETLLEVLNDIFTRFDSIADRHGIEKIKTIGDSYLAAAGLPIPIADHGCRMAHMALDVIAEMHRFNEDTGYNLTVRVGISTGAVVAGVIGKRKFFYDLWGDVVNTASRMESLSKPGRIQITQELHKLLKDDFTMEERGAIEVKGKGEMLTWFLNDRNVNVASG